MQYSAISIGDFADWLTLSVLMCQVLGPMHVMNVELTPPTSLFSWVRVLDKYAQFKITSRASLQVDVQITPGMNVTVMNLLKSVPLVSRINQHRNLIMMKQQRKHKSFRLHTQAIILEIITFMVLTSDDLILGHVAYLTNGSLFKCRHSN